MKQAFKCLLHFLGTDRLEEIKVARKDNVTNIIGSAIKVLFGYHMV